MVKIIRSKNSDKEIVKQNKLGDLEYLTFPALEALPDVKHLFSTRTGGVSTGDCASMNLSFSRGDDPQAVLENYRRISAVLRADVEDVVASVQTHTTNIRIVTGEDKGKGVVKPQDYQDIDGLITKERGILLACFYADCVPLYLVDPIKQVIGLAHSGWRGTVNRMGAHMVQTMQEQFGCNPSDLIVAIGPSICRDCYEVSEDVAAEFERAFPDTEVVTPGRMEGKYQLDLWLANRMIFEAAGVMQTHISVTDICTCHNPAYLFSHRASHGKRGNLGAFLMLEKE